MESSDRARIIVGGSRSSLIAFCTLVLAIGFTPWIPPGDGAASSWAQFGFRTVGLIALGVVSVAAARGSISCSPWGVKAAKAVVALVALASLSTAMSIQRGKSLEAMLNLLAILGIFLAAALLLRGARALRGIALTQVIAAVPVAALGIVQHFRPDLMPADSSYPGRALGPFGQPNRLGGYLIAVIPIALALAFAAQDRGIRLALLIAVFAFALCLVFTYSRGSWVGLVAGLAAFGVLLARWPDLRPNPALLAVAAVCLLAPALFALPAIVTRIAPPAQKTLSDSAAALGVPFDPERQGSGTMRRAVWSGAIRATAARPVLGFGPGAFREAYDRSKDTILKRLEAEGGRTADQAHSLYLVLSTERGVLGLGAFVLLAGLVLAGGLGTLETGAPVDARLLLAGLAASVVALLVHGAMEDNATFIPQGTSLFAALGLIVMASAAPGAKSSRRSRGLGALGLATVAAGLALSLLSVSADAATGSAAALRLAPWQERHALAAAKEAERAGIAGGGAAEFRVADQYYRSAIALNSSDPVTRHELARLYLSHPEAFGTPGPREAVAQLEAALAQNPYYAEIRNDLGVALLRTGERADAEAQFRQAAEGRRDFIEPLLNLAALAIERGDRAEAARQIDEALDRNPGSARALAMRAGLAAEGHR